MNYEKAKQAIKRQFTRLDGYAGDQITVGLSFVDGLAVEVSECGCYRSNARNYASESEMLYYFDHHQNVHFPQVIRQP